MRVVCDTSVLIDHLRDHPHAQQLLLVHAEAGDELWGVTVTRAEVLSGMRSSERAATRRLLDALQWADVDVSLADRAGALARRYRRSHVGIELPDYLVAAGAELLGARLLTTNVRHFAMFPDLEPPYPS